MAEPVVLSGSSLNTILRCGRQWEFAYVDRRRDPPSLKAALGIGAHEAIELDLRQKIDSGVNLPKEALLDTFRDAFGRTAVDSEETKTDTFGGMLDSGIAAVGFWYDDIGLGVKPREVEVNGQFTINGIPYDWTADLIDDEEWGLTRIRDWKFTGKSPSRNDGGRYILPMTGYAIGYRRLSGGIEAERVLDYIVRNKQPKHVPIVQPTVTDDEIVAFANLVTKVYTQINAGIFPPNGLQNGACSWCGFKRICPDYLGRPTVHTTGR